MIEDKEMGIKIAENENEATWSNVVKNLEQDIKNHEKGLMVSIQFLEVAKQKLTESTK